MRNRPTALWFDAECRVMKTTARKLEKAYRRHRSAQSEQAWRTQYIEQRALYQGKFVEYWWCAIDMCQEDSKALWSKLRTLLQPESVVASRLTADDFAQHFQSKIDRIRTSTASSSPPTIDERIVVEPLSDLPPATVDEIIAILNKATAKHCQLD